jgi:signal peptide peptidase SppA
LPRSVSFWRAAGIAGLALAAGALMFGGDKLATLSGQKQIARIAIEGAITEDRNQLKMLKDIAKADHVSGVLLYVNSPGGTTTGGEALYEGLREIAKTKPIVAQFGTVAASAGYIVGLGTDHIVARGNTITGSIGVIVQWPEFVQLLDKVGVKMNEVKSGPLKASPSPFEPLNEGGARSPGMVNDASNGFIARRAAARRQAGRYSGLTDGGFSLAVSARSEASRSDRRRRGRRLAQDVKKMARTQNRRLEADPPRGLRFWPWQLVSPAMCLALGPVKSRKLCSENAQSALTVCSRFGILLINKEK